MGATTKTKTKSTKQVSLRVRVMILDVLDAADRPVTALQVSRRLDALLDDGAPSPATVRLALRQLIGTREVTRFQRRGGVVRFWTV